MQTKGKKKIIDNAGALQKKYAWKSEKMQDTKKAPQDTKKQAAACPYAKKCGGCDYQGMSYEQQLQEKQTYVRKNIGVQRSVSVCSFSSVGALVKTITGDFVCELKSVNE